MISYLLERRIRAFLERNTGRREYPVLVGCAACAATLSMSFPFASLLVPAVLLRRQRWAAIAFFSGVGSALGGLLLYLAFRHLGWAQFEALHPEMVGSAAWLQSTRWMESYGSRALLLIAALPLPSTPAIAIAALGKLDLPEVFCALWLGKWLKYCAYAGLVSRFPQRFLRLQGPPPATEPGA